MHRSRAGAKYRIASDHDIRSEQCSSKGLSNSGKFRSSARGILLKFADSAECIFPTVTQNQGAKALYSFTRDGLPVPRTAVAVLVWRLPYLFQGGDHPFAITTHALSGLNVAPAIKGVIDDPHPVTIGADSLSRQNLKRPIAGA